MRVNGMETVTVVLAQPDFPGGEPPNGGQGEGFGKSTPVGLLLLIVLLIGVAFLIRSMSKHIRSLPGHFDQDRATAAAPARVRRAEAARQTTEAAQAEESSEESPEESSAGSRASPEEPDADSEDSATEAADGDTGGVKNGKATP